MWRLDYCPAQPDPRQSCSSSGLSMAALDRMSVLTGDIRDPRFLWVINFLFYLTALISVPQCKAPARHVDTYIHRILNLRQAGTRQLSRVFRSTATSEVYGTASLELRCAHSWHSAQSVIKFCSSSLPAWLRNLRWCTCRFCMMPQTWQRQPSRSSTCRYSAR
jgi:hypothetical protein